MNDAILILSSIALASFFVRGATGAAAGIVFNALFVALHASGLTGSLSFHDGLYWFALANGIAGMFMLRSLWGSIKLETLTRRYLLGMLPVNIVFSVFLTRVERSDVLAIVLALVVLASGAYQMARPRLPPARMSTLNKLAVPVGMLTGVLSGLYGMGGPIGLLLFGRATSDPALFRMRLTLIISLSSFVRLIILATQGVFTTERLVIAGWTVPAVVCGLVIGLWAHRFLRSESFKALLGGLVALAGAVALVESLLG